MPEWKKEIEKRLAGLHLRPEREPEIIDEVSGHLEDRYDEMRGRGSTHEQALRDVIAELDATDLAPVYMPLRQNYSDAMILYVRTERDPSMSLGAVQGEIRSLDPTLPMDDIRTGTKVIDQALWWSKTGVGLLGVLGLLALGLASVGLYGIMAYSVNQRRREIGVRMALGADQRDVSLFILRDGMTVVLSGVAAGAVLALLLGRGLSRFLYGVSGSDPLSLGGASIVLLLVAFVACYLPARSASRVDPLIALQQT